jgi:thiamine biosynthesis lipoprotein ApbE
VPSLVRPARTTHRGRALGTGCEMVLAAPTLVAPALEVLTREVAAIDMLASRFRPDSELSALNRAAGRAVRVSAQLMELIRVALWAAEVTDGAVDPTISGALVAAGYDRDFAEIPADRPGDMPPGQPVPGWGSVIVNAAAGTVELPAGCGIDLGATAKAVAADRAAAAVAAATGVATLVSLGGDMSIAGEVDAEGFSVALADTWDAPAEEATEAVTLRAGGLATSGIAARHWLVGGRPAHHLIDPATGRPVDGPWRTVTVAAATCLAANVASTASIVKGAAAPAWLGSLGLDAQLVAHDGSRVRTGAWPSDTRLRASRSAG